MSEEESEPAPLRLRPRLRPTTEPLPSEAPSGPLPPESSSDTIPVPDAEPPAERPRLRAKPRLNLDDEATGETASLPSAPAQGGDEAAASTDHRDDEQAAPLKLRLQGAPSAPQPPPPPPPPVAANAAMPPPLHPEDIPLPVTPPPVAQPMPAGDPTAPLPPVDAKSPPPPPFLVAAGDPPNDSPLRPPDHIVPHIRANLPVGEIDKQVKATLPKPPRRKNFPVKSIVALCLIFLVIGVCFWIAGRSIYQRFLADEPAAATTTLIVDKARSALTDRRSLEQQRIDAMADGREAPDARAIHTPPPSALFPAAPTPVESPTKSEQVTAYAPAPDPAPAPVKDTVAPAPSEEFLSLIDRAVIGGVFQGEPARALINGRTIRAGEVVDDDLGVIFVGLDETRRNLIFRDAVGAEVIRRF